MFKQGGGMWVKEKELPLFSTVEKSPWRKWDLRSTVRHSRFQRIRTLEVMYHSASFYRWTNGSSETAGDLLKVLLPGAQQNEARTSQFFPIHLNGAAGRKEGRKKGRRKWGREGGTGKVNRVSAHVGEGNHPVLARCFRQIMSFIPCNKNVRRKLPSSFYRLGWWTQKHRVSFPSKGQS